MSIARMGWLGVLASVLLCAAYAGCDSDPGLLLTPDESETSPTAGMRLVARIAHVSDSHLVDEESPARFAGAQEIASAAWRAYESHSTQLLDGVVRAVNRIHASGHTIDFLLHTGDVCDNAQVNELAWFLAIMDGDTVDPLTGPDDRPADTRPTPLLDPHAAFEAQGLYQAGVHGERPSIPWYVVDGNHDVYSIGVFAIFEMGDGRRLAPLPIFWRPGILLPVILDPLAARAHGNVTPANPGPPALLTTPSLVETNVERAYFNKREFAEALWTSRTEPPGHGFDAGVDAPDWYSVSPAEGLRLIGLDTTDHSDWIPGGLYSEGAISWAQLAWLRGELVAAAERDEIVVVATHHPTPTILPLVASEVTPDELRGLLNEFPGVVLHLAGHRHGNRVVDRGGYLEIETCSTLDWPQEGRLVEIWSDEAGGVAIAYEMFSHLDDTLPALGPDPLLELRAVAAALAQADKSAAARVRHPAAELDHPAGLPADRSGSVRLRR